MEKYITFLKLGNISSIIIDCLVMLLWFTTIRFSNNLFLQIMFILTILHSILIIFSYLVMRRNQKDYKVSKQQKLLVLGVLIITSLITLFLSIIGSDSLALLIVFVNSILVLLYSQKIQNG